MNDQRDQYGRCPYCNKKLGKLTEQYANKHIQRCMLKLNPYRYSDRKPGRPTNREREQRTE